MAIEKRTIREGTTDKIVMQLLADNDPINLTNVDHVELFLRDKMKTVYHYKSNSTSPQVAIEVAEEGTVSLEPTRSLFKAILSPYKGYWLVYEDADTYYSTPEDNEFEITVRGAW